MWVDKLKMLDNSNCTSIFGTKLPFTSMFLSLTILFSAERVLLVSLIVWGCRAPQLPIWTSIWGARVVGLPHEDKGEYTGLAIRVPTVHLVPGLCGKRGGRVGKGEGGWEKWLQYTIQRATCRAEWNQQKITKDCNFSGIDSKSHLSQPQDFCIKIPNFICFWYTPHSWQLTPLPKQVQSICLLPWFLIQRCPS